MKLKPSKRPKKRYIVFEVVSDKLNDDSAIYKSIRSAAMNILGVKYSEAGIRFLKDKYRSRIHRGIFRVNNDYSKSLISGLNKGHVVKTVGVSGILKKAENKYLKIAS
jgi:RNase P/RNase MRP subunit POP5